MSNYEKLKRIYELILSYDEEYGKPISLETLEVSNEVREIKTIDDLLEDLENKKP
jgi:acyl carrier protein